MTQREIRETKKFYSNPILTMEELEEDRRIMFKRFEGKYDIIGLDSYITYQIIDEEIQKRNRRNRKVSA